MKQVEASVDNCFVQILTQKHKFCIHLFTPDATKQHDRDNDGDINECRSVFRMKSDMSLIQQNFKM